MIKRIVSVLSSIFFALWLASEESFEWEPFICLFSSFSAYIVFEITDQENKNPKYNYSHKKRKGRIKTELEKRVLVFLTKNDGASPSFISEKLELTYIEASHVADELYSKGFINRPLIGGPDAGCFLDASARKYIIKNKLV